LRSGRTAAIRAAGRLRLAGRRTVAYDEPRDLVLHRREQLARHPNAVRFVATSEDGSTVLARTYYSIGGGFVVDEGAPLATAEATVPYPFSSGGELLARCGETGLSVAALMSLNEQAKRSAREIHDGLVEIWEAMSASIDAGMTAEGLLPGFLKVPRRARRLHEQLGKRAAGVDPLDAMEWLNLYARAVSEENAAGGRVVTAPTNGAAGIVPAVIRYYVDFVPGADEAHIVDFLLAAGAVATLCMQAASISGAEVGCQGEVGSACAMAAAGFCQVLGGAPGQVENAAEIAIEHHLGLTCDPVGGFVQVPCIERNAVAAVTAVNAARMALSGDGTHRVSLDQVLETMRQTGADMKSKYKETSRGGLAVNVPAC